MKKIILLLLLLAVGISASARKSYITVYGASLGIMEANGCITGDVPVDVDGLTYDEHWQYYVYTGYTADLLNKLSERGYEVELMTQNGAWTNYLLSKEIPSNQAEIEGDLNKDNEVNIADVNKLINIILGFIRDNPKIQELIK